MAVEDWFGRNLPMEGIKSSSIAFTHVPEVLQEPFACFCGEDKHGCHLELYPRPNGASLDMVCCFSHCSQCQTSVSLRATFVSPH